MAAGLGFKDFVTGEVLTAGDVDGYLMQGTWVFASAAARDAAVTSPQEGNMCYLKDTDAVQYYSGSAWTAIGGSGGMTLLTPAVTLSGATVTIPSISQNYKSLVAFIYGMTNATADGVFRIAPNGDTTSCNAVQIQTNNNAASGPVTLGGNGYINTNVGLTRTNNDNNMVLTIPNYTVSGIYQSYTFNGYMRSTTPGDMAFFQSGYIGVLAPVTSLVFSNAGGNLSTGTVLLYGVN
jgi:hypothetical protein